jgi:hypothetical protein
VLIDSSFGRKVGLALSGWYGSTRFRPSYTQGRQRDAGPACSKGTTTFTLPRHPSDHVRDHLRNFSDLAVAQAVEGRLEAPKHLVRTVHDLYFEPKYEEFRPRTIWSLSNAFTSAFKELDPIPQFKATAKLSEFLEARFSRAF